MVRLEEVTVQRGMSGNVANTNLSNSKYARALDPDLHPWERQAEEPHESYQMFLVYRDMEQRRIVNFDQPEYADRGWNSRKGRELSSMWSWGHRCLHWDRYQGAVDTEEMVRYRRLMAARHRTVARAAQEKIAKYLNDLDVSTLKPHEAARWYWIATRIEREAAAGGEGPSLPITAEDDQGGGDFAETPTTLADLMGVDPTVEADLAVALHKLLNPPG